MTLWLLLHIATTKKFLLNGNNGIVNTLAITESRTREVLKQVAQKFQPLLSQVCRGDYHLPAVRRPANFLSIVTLSVSHMRKMPPQFKFLMLSF